LESFNLIFDENKKGNEDFILFEFISCSKFHPSPYQGEGNRKVLISSSMRIKKVVKILFCLNSYHVLNSTRPFQGEGNRKVLNSSSMRIKKVVKILFCLNSYYVLIPNPLLTKEREIGRGFFYDEAL